MVKSTHKNILDILDPFSYIFLSQACTFPNIAVFLVCHPIFCCLKLFIFKIISKLWICQF